MRPAAVVALAALAVSSPARAEPLATAELRLGYGLASGGGAGRAAVRSTPLVLAAGGALAVIEEPHVAGYADIVIETLDRTGAGVEGGFLATPSDRLRLRGGVVAIVRPYTLWGVTFGSATCGRRGAVRMCVELDADVFVGGTDLPDKSAVFQVLAGFGVVIDAQ